MGVFTSTSALKCASSQELNRLYYQTTSRNAYNKGAGDVSPRGRTMSMAEIHEIGKKATKFCPMRHKKAPLPGRDQCWYAKDYFDRSKSSDLNMNRDLAEVFKGGRVV